ncbi:hypothetical protein XENTR_v10016363 [Xenopus tropicalis]|nr:hypothetical protein XENTR_v10016363 [Xenopus tropicalis]
MKGTADSSGTANSSTNAISAAGPIRPCDALKKPGCLQKLQRWFAARMPVSVQKMSPWLDQYHRKGEAALIRDGFTYGFFIPFTQNSQPTFAENLKSVPENWEIVATKLRNEVAMGRMAGPFPSLPFPNLRISPLGVVPKKEPGKFRLIHYLSHPKGNSVNDGISKEAAAVSYVSFDRAVSLVRQAGRGALLAKSDIESASRLLPIHRDCYHLLGCQFEGQFYYDLCLPMGCSISCRYFECFSTFLEWVVRHETGHNSVIHYLDDFLFIGPPNTNVCQLLLSTFQFFMAKFGVPLSREKTEGPVPVLSFLGIEIDTVELVFRLPDDKLQRLKSTVAEITVAKKVTLRSMQSLLGLLVFACRIMPIARVFSRRLSLSTCGIKQPHHFIRITRQLREDLTVWQTFLEQYNGHTCLMDTEVSNEELSLFTDAAGSTGFGAILAQSWCAEQWPDNWAPVGLCKNMTLLELFPIVVTVEIWGHRISGKKICFWTDNMSVVFAINKLTSSSLPVLALLRHLVLRCLELNIWFRARHVPGRENFAADALSRFQWGTFRELVPDAEREGAKCPVFLWRLVEDNC